MPPVTGPVHPVAALKLKRTYAVSELADLFGPLLQQLLELQDFPDILQCYRVQVATVESISTSYLICTRDDAEKSDVRNLTLVEPHLNQGKQLCTAGTT